MPRSKKVATKTKTKKTSAKAAPKKSAAKKKKTVKKVAHGGLMNTLLLGAAVVSVYAFVLIFTSSLFVMAL